MNIAIAIIRHPTEDRILIAKREGAIHLSGLWEFPGGKLEVGETATDAVVRECREEVHIDVLHVEPLPLITYDYPDRTVTLHPYICRIGADQLQFVPDRATWAPRNDLPAYEFPAANEPILALLLGEGIVNDGEVTS